MSTLLLTHPACLDHDTGPGHPERPERLVAIMQILEGEDFALLHRDEAPHATTEQLLRVHPQHHIAAIMDHLPAGESLHYIDPDTVLSAQSGEAALRAAGAVIAAVDAVAKGEVRNAFCAVRPPGHHAERDEAMGFCLFNNVAIGAMHARAAHGFRRVAVVDFDVHHGNGTEHLFHDDAEAFYGSTHQSNAYPGTGYANEHGIAGNICNAPLPPGATGEQFRHAMDRIVLPALREFKPDFIFISAGFDGHAADHIAQLRLQVADFGWATREILKIADESCGSRVVSTLEGGYDLPALAACVADHVRGLMGS